MSEPSNTTPYDAKRVFAALIVLTALEVGWGIGFHHDTGRIGKRLGMRDLLEGHTDVPAKQLVLKPGRAGV